jgi:hypothetical protein
MDRVAATERVTAVAVDNAPQKGANYAYIISPGLQRRAGGLLPLREPAGLSEPTTESLLRQERTAG